MQNTLPWSKYETNRMATNDLKAWTPAVMKRSRQLFDGMMQGTITMLRGHQRSPATLIRERHDAHVQTASLA
jgi:hypothetical protein